MKRLSLLLVVLLSPPLHSQDLARVFMPFLPEKVLTNADYKRVAMLELEKKAKLHPDLIAYYINYLENLFAEQPVETNVNAFYNSMIQAEQKYLIQRNAYLEKQIAFLQDRYSGHDLTPHVRQFFQRNISKINPLIDTPSTPLEIDQQMQDYLGLLYYTQSASLKFDPSTNYQDRRIEQEQQKYDELSRLKQKLERNEINPDPALLNQMLECWHILDRMENRPKSVPLGIEIAYRVLAPHRSAKSYKRLSLGIEYSPINTTPHFIHDIRIDGAHQEYLYFRKTNVPQAGVSLSVVLFKKKYLNPLSYLTAKASWSTNLQNQTANTKDLMFDANHSDGANQYHDTYIFDEKAMTLNRVNLYTFSLQTPLYFAHRTLGLEAELGVGYYNIDYTVEYQYVSTEREGNISRKGLGKYWRGNAIDPDMIIPMELDCHINRIRFLPALHLRYQPMSWLSIAVSGYVSGMTCAIRLSI